jgi:hypothetical protein
VAFIGLVPDVVPSSNNEKGIKVPKQARPDGCHVNQKMPDANLALTDGKVTCKMDNLKNPAKLSVGKPL